MKKNQLLSFLKTIPTNLFAGFVVSLVSLPLGLGLAMASGAPPISGIIAAVVGGIIVSILGGSNVTITGPGNGLVVAALAAITTLGEGDMYQGYLFTLAAIIVSGAVILLLAFANLGKLSNFFPSTAIQGLLAAIGIIILAKQFHIMVGNMEAEGSTIELLLSIPSATYYGLRNEYSAPAAIAGLVSLGILIFYARIRNKFFQLIPAPMWIVVISIGLATIFENHIGMKHPIPKDYFVKISADVLSAFPTPDFSKAFTLDFIIAVFTLSMIASVESLLSIKAVDKLDPEKRQSNVGRDLKALGLATMVSGFFGGLNVVTVIARSSVNVNNNASNRSANFFQAIFLILFILLFSQQLQHIPFPALAAILVYTGYKLAAPSKFMKVMSVGKEQAFIFVFTILTTLFTNLIIGILAGILITFLVHAYLAKGFSLFFKSPLKYTVANSVNPEGDTIITVKYYSSFLNYFLLKKEIDKLDSTQKVLVDFSQCTFIDYTIVENMWNYKLQFEKNGGVFSTKGITLMAALVAQPNALQKAMSYIPFIEEFENLSKRQQFIQKFCTEIGWTFNAQKDYHSYFLSNFEYFRKRQVEYIFNHSKNASNQIEFFDIEYSEGEFIAEEDLHASMVFIQTGKIIPAFTLDKVDLYERLHYLSHFKEVKLSSFRDFAKRFSLRANNLREIRKFFDDKLIRFFESNNYYHIESNGKGGILIMDKERQSSIGEMKAMIDFSIRLHETVFALSSD